MKKIRKKKHSLPSHPKKHKYKKGARVAFTFLGGPMVGTIIELTWAAKQSATYKIRSGNTTYPTAGTNGSGLVCNINTVLTSKL